MKAVWSFWSKPFAVHRKAMWGDERRHHLAWVLSVMLARQHYPEIGLVTDDAGAHLLVDQLQLPFVHVSTALNDLAQEDALWWTLGKIYTYSLQTEPFVHLDSDVFLWKRLPDALEQADVFAQHPYLFSRTHITQLAQVMGGDSACWLPEELAAYACQNTPLFGAAAGILGGWRTDFIRHYAHAAMKLLVHPRNRPCWKHIGDSHLSMLAAEECLLAAAVAFHQAHAASPFCNIQIRYLFNSPEAFLNRGEQMRAGFSHCGGTAKQHPVLVARIEQRVREDYPAWYARC